jgi:hypothetical protein
MFVCVLAVWGSEHRTAVTQPQLNARRALHKLSKSRFTAGKQCHKLLCLEEPASLKYRVSLESSHAMHHEIECLIGSHGIDPISWTPHST